MEFGCSPIVKYTTTCCITAAHYIYTLEIPTCFLLVSYPIASSLPNVTCSVSRVLIRNKLKGATAMLNMFSGGASKASAGDDADFEEDRDRLRDFQFKMLELQVRYMCEWVACVPLARLDLS